MYRWRSKNGICERRRILSGTARDGSWFVVASRACCGCLGSILFFSSAIAADSAIEQLHFNRDIRPMLLDAWFACQGPEVARLQMSIATSLTTRELVDGSTMT